MKKLILLLGLVLCFGGCGVDVVDTTHDDSEANIFIIEDFTDLVLIDLAYNYEYVSSPISSNLLLVKIDGKYGFINNEGVEVLAPTYTYFTSFVDGDYYIVSMDNEHFGVIEVSDVITEILPCEYDDIETEQDNFFIVTLDGKQGIINQANEIILPFIYEDLQFSFSGTNISAKIDGKWGLIDITGEILLDFIYDESIFFNNQNDADVQVDGQTGVIDDIIVISDDFYACKNNGEWQIFNSNNEVLNDEFYTDVSAMYMTPYIDYINVRIGAYWDYINNQGELIIPAEFDTASYVLNQYINLTKDGKAGIIDIYNNEIVPFIYDDINNAGDYFAVNISDNWGVVSTDGELIIPIIYETIFNSGQSYISVFNGTNWALFDIDGVQITDFVFDEYIRFTNETTTAVIDGEYYLLQVQ